MAASRVGKILHRFFVIPLLLYTLQAPFTRAQKSEIKVGIMHYGSYESLGISCERNEIIMISSEKLGYSTDENCNPRKMCSVPYTLAKWYCRGKSSCAGIPVERRPLHKRTCGSDFTNCLRVEYHCVKRSQLINVCGNHNIGATQVYLTSPWFPEMYPPDQNCTCKMTIPQKRNSQGQIIPRQSRADTQLQLKSVFFLLKATRPCKDWVGVKTDNRHWGIRCGYNPKESLFRGKEIELKFRSDDHHQEMGFWMELKATNNVPFHLQCGRYLDPNAQINMPRNARRKVFQRANLGRANRLMKQRFAKIGRLDHTGEFSKTNPMSNVNSKFMKSKSEDKKTAVKTENEKSGKGTSKESDTILNSNPNKISTKTAKTEKSKQKVRRKYHEILPMRSNKKLSSIDTENAVSNHSKIADKQKQTTDVKHKSNNSELTSLAKNEFASGELSKLDVEGEVPPQEANIPQPTENKEKSDNDVTNAESSDKKGSEEVKVDHQQTKKPVIPKDSRFILPTTPKRINVIKATPPSQSFQNIESDSTTTQPTETVNLNHTTTETMSEKQETVTIPTETEQPTQEEEKQRYFNPYTGEFGWKYESEQINQGKRNMSDIPEPHVLEQFLQKPASDTHGIETKDRDTDSDKPVLQDVDNVNVITGSDEIPYQEPGTTMSVISVEADTDLKHFDNSPKMADGVFEKSEDDTEPKPQAFTWQSENKEILQGSYMKTAAKEGVETEDKFGMYYSNDENFRLPAVQTNHRKDEGELVPFEKLLYEESLSSTNKSKHMQETKEGMLVSDQRKVSKQKPSHGQRGSTKSAIYHHPVTNHRTTTPVSMKIQFKKRTTTTTTDLPETTPTTPTTTLPTTTTTHKTPSSATPRPVTTQPKIEFYEETTIPEEITTQVNIEATELPHVGINEYPGETWAKPSNDQTQDNLATETKSNKKSESDEELELWYNLYSDGKMFDLGEDTEWVSSNMKQNLEESEKIPSQYTGEKPELHLTHAAMDEDSLFESNDLNVKDFDVNVNAVDNTVINSTDADNAQNFMQETEVMQPKEMSGHISKHSEFSNDVIASIVTNIDEPIQSASKSNELHGETVEDFHSQSSRDFRSNDIRDGPYDLSISYVKKPKLITRHDLPETAFKLNSLTRQQVKIPKINFQSHFSTAKESAFRKIPSHNSKLMTQNGDIDRKNVRNEAVIKDQTFLNSYHFKPYGEKLMPVILTKPIHTEISKPENSVKENSTHLTQLERKESETTPPQLKLVRQDHSNGTQAGSIASLGSGTKQTKESVTVRNDPANALLYQELHSGEEMYALRSDIKGQTKIGPVTGEHEINLNAQIDNLKDSDKDDTSKENTDMHVKHSFMESYAKSLPDSVDDTFAFGIKYDTPNILHTDIDDNENLLSRNNGKQDYENNEPILLTGNDYDPHNFRIVSEMNNIDYKTQYEKMNPEANEDTIVDQNRNVETNDLDELNNPEHKISTSTHSTEIGVQEDPIPEFATPPYAPTTITKPILNRFISSRSQNNKNIDTSMDPEVIPSRVKDKLTSFENPLQSSKETEPSDEYPFLSLYPSYASLDDVEVVEPEENDVIGSDFNDESVNEHGKTQNENGKVVNPFQLGDDVIALVKNANRERKLNKEQNKFENSEKTVHETEDNDEFSVKINKPVSNSKEEDDFASQELNTEKPNNDTDYQQSTAMWPEESNMVNSPNGEELLTSKNCQNIVHSDINTIIATVDSVNAAVNSDSENEEQSQNSLKLEQPINVLPENDIFSASKDNSQFHKQPSYDMYKASKMLEEREGVPNILLKPEEKAMIEEYAYDLGMNHNEGMFDYLNYQQTTQSHEETLQEGSTVQPKIEEIPGSFEFLDEVEKDMENLENITEFYTSIDPVQTWYDRYNSWAEQYYNMNTPEDRVREDKNVHNEANSEHEVLKNSKETENTQHTDRSALYEGHREYYDAHREEFGYEDKTAIPESYSEYTEYVTAEPEVEEIMVTLTQDNEENNASSKFLDSQKQGPLDGTGILLSEEELSEIVQDAKNHNEKDPAIVEDPIFGPKKTFVNLDNWNDHKVPVPHENLKLNAPDALTVNNDVNNVIQNADTDPNAQNRQTEMTLPSNHAETGPGINEFDNHNDERNSDAGSKVDDIEIENRQNNSNHEPKTDNSNDLKQLDLNNDEKFAGFFKMIHEASTSSAPIPAPVIENTTEPIHVPATEYDYANTPTPNYDYSKTYEYLHEYADYVNNGSDAVYAASNATQNPVDSNNYIMENLEELYELLNELENELQNVTADEESSEYQHEFQTLEQAVNSEYAYENLNASHENGQPSVLDIDGKEGSSSAYDNKFGFQDNLVNKHRAIPIQPIPDKVDPVDDNSNANEYNPDHWWNSYWHDKRRDVWDSHVEPVKHNVPHEGWGFPLPHIPNETRVPPQLQLRPGEFSIADQRGAYQAIGPPVDKAHYGNNFPELVTQPLPHIYNDNPTEVMKTEETAHGEKIEKPVGPYSPIFREGTLDVIDYPHPPLFLPNAKEGHEQDNHPSFTFNQLPLQGLPLDHQDAKEGQSAHDMASNPESMVAERKAWEQQHFGLHQHDDTLLEQFGKRDPNHFIDSVLVNDNQIRSKDRTFNKDSKQLPDNYLEQSPKDIASNKGNDEPHTWNAQSFNEVRGINIPGPEIGNHITDPLSETNIKPLTQLEMDPFPHHPPLMDNDIPETGFETDKRFFETARIQLPLLPIFPPSMDAHLDSISKPNANLAQEFLNGNIIEDSNLLGDLKQRENDHKLEDKDDRATGKIDQSRNFNGENVQGDIHDRDTNIVKEILPHASLSEEDIFSNQFNPHINVETNPETAFDNHISPWVNHEEFWEQTEIPSQEINHGQDFTREIERKDILIGEKKNPIFEHDANDHNSFREPNHHGFVTETDKFGNNLRDQNNNFRQHEQDFNQIRNRNDENGRSRTTTNSDVIDAEQISHGNENPFAYKHNWNNDPLGDAIMDLIHNQREAKEALEMNNNKPATPQGEKPKDADVWPRHQLDSRYNQDQENERHRNIFDSIQDSKWIEDPNTVLKPDLSRKEKFFQRKDNEERRRNRKIDKIQAPIPIPLDKSKYHQDPSGRYLTPMETDPDSASSSDGYELDDGRWTEGQGTDNDPWSPTRRTNEEKAVDGIKQPIPGKEIPRSSSNDYGYRPQTNSPLQTANPRDNLLHRALDTEKQAAGKFGGFVTKSQEGLMEIDPNLYGRVKDYWQKKIQQTQRILPMTTEKDLEYSEWAAISEKQNTKKKGMSKDTVYVLLVIAVIGWIIFMVMIGLLIYYKRDRMCYRKFGRRSAYTSSYASSMPKHLMFPDLHSPLCSLSQPQLSSGEPSPNAPPSRSDSTNSADSLLGIAAHNQHLARTKARPDHRLQINAISLGDNRSSGGHSPRSVTDSMSDRPLPPLPGQSSNIDKSPGVHKRTPSSFCPEMMLGANTSKSSENMAAQSNVVGISDRDLILLDKKSTKTIHDTFRSNKSHYQSLNTIRSRKAKSRGGTPETKRQEGNDDAIFSASMHHLETSFDDIQRETENRLRSNNVDSWIFTNQHLNKDDPQLVISHINLRSPRPDQRKQITPLNVSTFVNQNEGPSKTSSPTQTKSNRMKQNIDRNSKSIPENTKRTPPLGGSTARDKTQGNSNSPQPHIHKSVPHNYQQLSTPFTNRKPGNPIRADIIRTKNPQMQKPAAPAKPRRADRPSSNRSLVTSDADNSQDSNSMDAIFQSLTQIANKYGAQPDGPPKSMSPSSSKCSTVSMAPPVPPPPKATTPPLSRSKAPNQSTGYAGPMKQVGPLYQNTQHLKTNNVMAVKPPTLPEVHGKDRDSSKSAQKPMKSEKSPKSVANLQKGRASPDNANENKYTIQDSKSNGAQKASPKVGNANPAPLDKTVDSPKTKKTKSGSYDLVINEKPNIIYQYNTGLSNGTNEDDNENYDSDNQSISDGEPVLLKEHRRLPGDTNIAANEPQNRADSRGKTSRNTPSPRRQKSKKSKAPAAPKGSRERSQFAQASMMLMNTCPDLQRQQQRLQEEQQYSFDDVPMFPFNPNYRNSAQDQAQRLLNTISKKKPGSSAERIRKIIPEQASLFNEKVKPELNRILNERNVKRDSVNV